MNRRLLLLAATAAVLAAVVLLERVDWPEAQRPDAAAQAPAAPSGEPVRLNPLAGLAQQSFPAVLERPLFNPGRAGRLPEPPPPPPPVAEEPPPPPPPEPQGPGAADFTLVAVSSGPSGKVAALRVAATGDVVYAREGQPVDGWTVLAIDDRSVVIGADGSGTEFKLFDSADMEQDVAPPGMQPEMAPDPAMEELPVDQQQLPADGTLQ